MIYESPSGEQWPFCACGSPLALRLFIHCRYPRTAYLPEAMDPWYVHGSGYSIEICGDPRCEPDALAACRTQIIDDYVLRALPWMPSGLTDEQIAGLELAATREPGGLISVLGDDDDD
jgi:hypothetical protein